VGTGGGAHELIAPEIDLSSGGGRRGVGAVVAGASARAAAGANAGGAAVLTRAEPLELTQRRVLARLRRGQCIESSALGRVAVLQRWRGGRIDMKRDGAPARCRCGANPLSVQIRRATLRRSDDEWNVAGFAVSA